MRIRQSPLLLRLFAWVACALCVVGGVGPQLHEALVQHTYCAEHATFEHGSDGPEASARSMDGAGPVARATPDAAHGDGCTAWGLSGASAIRSQPRVALLPIEGAAAPQPLVDPAAPRGPPLAYAPKTSPPTVA